MTTVVGVGLHIFVAHQFQGSWIHSFPNLHDPPVTIPSFPTTIAARAPSPSRPSSAPAESAFTWYRRPQRRIHPRNGETGPPVSPFSHTPAPPPLPRGDVLVSVELALVVLDSLCSIICDQPHPPSYQHCGSWRGVPRHRRSTTGIPGRALDEGALERFSKDARLRQRLLRGERRVFGNACCAANASLPEPPQG